MATKKIDSPIAAPEIDESTVESPFDPVRIKLPRDRNEGKGLYVNVNDHNWFIPRGEIVVVPRYVAEVIENSIKQDERTQALIDRLAEKGEAAANL